MATTIGTFGFGEQWAVIEHEGYTLRVTGESVEVTTPSGKLATTGTQHLREIPESLRAAVSKAGKEPETHRLLGAAVVPASIESTWLEVLAEVARAAKERQVKIRKHDAVYNEGVADGYNPHDWRRR